MQGASSKSFKVESTCLDKLCLKSHPGIRSMCKFDGLARICRAMRGMTRTGVIASKEQGSGQGIVGGKPTNAASSLCVCVFVCVVQRDASQTPASKGAQSKRLGGKMAEWEGW